MKFGPRRPSLKRSIKARTTGRAKRSIKKAVNPMYGKKGTGWIRDPKKAAYNKVYNKTTFDTLASVKQHTNRSNNKNKQTNVANNNLLVGTIKHRMKQLIESTELISETNKPEVFFNRYAFVIEIAIEVYEILEENFEAKQALELINIIRPLIDNRSGIISEFIDKYYKYCYKDASNLKTERGRANRLIRNYQDLMRYKPILANEHIEKVNSLWSKDISVDDISFNEIDYQKLDFQDDKIKKIISDGNINALSFQSLPNDKSKTTTWVLLLFFGIFGAHRFYLNGAKKGFVYFTLSMLTFGMFGIGMGFIDLFYINRKVDSINEYKKKEQIYGKANLEYKNDADSSKFMSFCKKWILL